VIALTPIGRVRSPLTDPARAPKQGFEGAPEAWLELEPAFAEALSGLQAGQEALVLTWLHRADRETLRVHPRDDPRAPLAGVFATRSQPDRDPPRPHPRDRRRPAAARRRPRGDRRHPAARPQTGARPDAGALSGNDPPGEGAEPSIGRRRREML